jgi:hypothetical protein
MEYIRGFVCGVGMILCWAMILLAENHANTVNIKMTVRKEDEAKNGLD